MSGKISFDKCHSVVNTCVKKAFTLGTFARKKVHYSSTHQERDVGM